MRTRVDYVWFTSVRAMAGCCTLTLEDGGALMEGRFPCGACCLGNAVSSNSDSNDRLATLAVYFALVPCHTV